jgi:uncharacterized membrane protein YGL010W
VGWIHVTLGTSFFVETRRKAVVDDIARSLP